MAELFEYSQNIDVANRASETAKLPARLNFTIEYDYGDSNKLQKHVYQVRPFMYVNTGEQTKVPLNKYNFKQYSAQLTNFSKVFTLKDFDRYWEIEELPESFREKLENHMDEIKQMYRVPNDLTFQEEELLYVISMDISWNKVLQLFGREMPVEKNSNDEIEELKKQNVELLAMCKELIAELNKKKDQ